MTPAGPHQTKKDALRGMKGAQIVSLHKNLTDALEAIDRMEADSAQVEQNGGAA